MCGRVEGSEELGDDNMLLMLSAISEYSEPKNGSKGNRAASACK